MNFSSFGIAIKIPQGVHFAFSAPLCQRSDVTQPNSQMHHPANGGKNGVSTGQVLTPAGTARVTSNAKQHGPKEKKVSPESRSLQLRQSHSPR